MYSAAEFGVLIVQHRKVNISLWLDRLEVFSIFEVLVELCFLVFAILPQTFSDEHAMDREFDFDNYSNCQSITILY